MCQFPTSISFSFIHKNTPFDHTILFVSHSFNLILIFFFITYVCMHKKIRSDFDFKTKQKKKKKKTLKTSPHGLVHWCVLFFKFLLILLFFSFFIICPSNHRSFFKKNLRNLCFVFFFIFSIVYSFLCIVEKYVSFSGKFLLCLTNFFFLKQNNSTHIL